MKELTIALAAAVVLSTAVASAAPVSFSDELKITIGTIVDSDQFLTESDESAGPPVLVGTPDIIPAFSNMSSESTLAFFEPGSNSMISDLLTVSVGPRTVHQFFTDQIVVISLSSVDTPSTFPRFDVQTVETGTLQDVTSFFPELSGSNLKIEVMSDGVDNPATVPEPASLLLLGGGLLGGAWIRKRLSRGEVS